MKRPETLCCNAVIIMDGTTEIPCVLILVGNKTYGRASNSKMLYKCVPHDTELPCLLVPYQPIGTLEKTRNNIYVSVVFVSGNRGRMCNSYGDVSIPENFYKYQLVCNNLDISIKQLHKNVFEKIKKHGSIDVIVRDIVEKYNIEDRTGWEIITIDPDGSMDLDDAMGIKYMENDVKQISVYIANVAIWADVLDLWEHMYKRVASVYLPDKITPMLPPQLSTNACSLLQGERRIAFTMDITVENGVVTGEPKYSNTLINVMCNCTYENVHENPIYEDIRKTLYPCTEDSHDLVAQMMIFMNHNIALKMVENGIGVYRSTFEEKKEHKEMEIKGEDESNFRNIPDKYKQFVNPNNDVCSGKYTTDVSQLYHSSLNLLAYTHITSPIRRIVDIVNLVGIQKAMSLFPLSDRAHDFYKYWCGDESIKYLNKQMKSISKVQSLCKLLDLCTTNNSKCLKGYIFGRKIVNNVYRYDVYLPDIKMYSSIHSVDYMENYGNYECKIITFDANDTLRKKVRIQIV